MMDWKKLGKQLLFPHPMVVALLAAGAVTLLVWAFLALEETAPLRIAAYVLSFAALVLVCVRAPGILRWVRHFRQENKYYLRYKEDVQLRINISLYAAFVFNTAYAALQLGLGLWHHSAWFYAMAGYYLLLAMMRLTLMRHIRRHIPGEERQVEWRKYHFCGVMLLGMNLALAVFTLYFVFRIRIFRHHEITTIAMAAYTFGSLTMSIINAVRCRKYRSPACSAAKAISLAAATVSMLTLENAMLTTFGTEDDALFRQIILGVSGVAVMLMVLGIALYMIVNGRRNLKTNGEHLSNGE